MARNVAGVEKLLEGCSEQSQRTAPSLVRAQNENIVKIFSKATGEHSDHGVWTERFVLYFRRQIDDALKAVLHRW
jgi:hypothetical protein